MCGPAEASEFRDFGMSQASMRWDADPGKVYKDVLRLALQRQVEKGLLLRGHGQGADRAEV